MIWGDFLKTNHHNDNIVNEEMVDISGNKESIDKVYKSNSGGKRYADKKNNTDKSHNKSDNKIGNTADVEVDINQQSAGSRFKSAGADESGSEKPIHNKKKIAIISSVVAVAVLAVVGVTGFVLYNSAFSPNSENFSANTSYVFRFTEGTVVSGVSIGNKTLEQAKEILEKNKDSFIDPISISVDADGEVIQLSEKNFEYTFDIDEVLNKIKADETDITDSSNKKSSSSLKTGSTAPSDYVVTATVTEESIEKNIKEIEKSANKDAVNARVSEFTPYGDNRFTYAEAEQGRKINSEDLTQKITEFLDSDKSEIRIEAEVEKTDADIQLDDVKKNIVLLAKYETVSYNTANGTNNMAVSLKACNGSVIEPGEVWSFNKCTGDSNLEENGYLPAHVISDGKLVDGIGGGLCQSSSTIYNAAIRANMDIEERANHKWASTYVPTGLDATIDYPSLDLKLKNPTDYQMFLECKVYDGNVLTASIWGYKPSSYDEIVTENVMGNQSSDSYSVEAFRVYMKDGKEVDRESLGKSTYDLDSGHGVVFYDAANDSNAKSVTTKTEPTTKKPESSSGASQNTNSQSSSAEKKQESSQSSQTATAQPTTKKPESSQSSQPETQSPTQPQESSTTVDDQNPDESDE